MTMQQLIDLYGVWACRAGWGAWHRRGFKEHGWAVPSGAVENLAKLRTNRSPDLVRAIVNRALSRQPDKHENPYD